MVGITIQNHVNQNDKPVGISFGRKEQISREVIWSVFERMSHSNSTFNSLDMIGVTVHSGKMPVGFGRCAMKSNGRPIAIMVHLKRSIVKLNAEDNCLAHDLVITISRIEKDSKYNSYRIGCRKSPEVRNLCMTNGIDLSNGVGIRELVRFQEQIREYKIFVYHDLKREDIMFERQVDSSKRINILYDGVEGHYHVFVNIIVATAKKYVCKGCKKSYSIDVMQSATRRIATAWPGLRARSKKFESPAPNGTGILEAERVSPTISGTAQQRNICM